MSANEFWEQLFKEQNYDYPPKLLKEDDSDQTILKNIKRCVFCTSKEIRLPNATFALNLAGLGKIPR